MMESWNHADLVTEADKQYTEKIGEIMKQLPELQQAYIEGLAEGIRRALELVKTGATKGEGAA